MKLFNKKFNFFLLIIFAMSLLLFTALSCDTTEPIEDNTQPGKRNYVWSVDSVDYGDLPGFIELRSIWGSSPNNVWGAGFTEDVRNCLWHYNGEKWSRAVWDTPITEFGNGSKSVGGVWGTAADDVWAFGGRIYSNTMETAPFIMHFDGKKWSEVEGDNSQMPDGYTDIYPINENHFWISSSNHVSEYKEGMWRKYFIGENYFVQSIGGIGNSVYLTAYPIGVDSLFLMKLRGNKFIVVDQTKLLGNAKFEQNGLLFAHNKVYTFGGNGVFTANLDGEEILYDEWKNELFLPNGVGFRTGYNISYKDIWGIGSRSTVYQFNGEDWQQLFIDHQEEATFTGIWGNGNEIFISDTENGFVYHGK
ncbi:MAG: hypothetical protein K9J16_18985 [Melioribacteraceae bacterium]|nr:hypothetical protein [Melioribacteraceae bacterium]MCF8354714.1 hypothetical protein [Melioribacteraceae bacterium]MCF8396453.1 hypothetical protein [Melioribacteraceae bacterium]MCF8418072.1 hypothetical protein [Melioribacteraceae bacterium]